MKKNRVLIVILVFIIILSIPLIGFIHLKKQISSLKVEVQTLKSDYGSDSLKSEIEFLQAEIEMLQNDQAMMNYNQRRLIEAMNDWLDLWQVDTFKASAYSPLDDRNGLNSWGDGEYMRSGVKTREHIDPAIAVDPKVIPLGTRVYIHGEGWRVAQDTGGAIKGQRIDIPMWSFDDAINHEVREVLVVYPKREG